MRILFLAGTLLALPAAASMFGARYPAGSIGDTAQSQAALKDADAEIVRIGNSAKLREAECYRGFLVNSCRDNVRREKELAEREVKRVQLEARALQRRLDAEKVAKQRVEKTEVQAAAEAQRLQKEELARAKNIAREAELQRRGALPTGEGQREQGGQAESTQARGGQTKSSQAKDAAQRTERSAPDRLTAAERANNAAKFQQKQYQAEKRAQEQEAERKKNEQRRAEKRKQLEQREAEREAVRKKAAEFK